jgi:hypothetical protein
VCLRAQFCESQCRRRMVTPSTAKP